MSDTTFEAATVDEALEKAAAALGVAAAELQHEVVEKKRDFWGGGDDTIVIKAWKSAAKEEPVKVEEEPAEVEEASQPAAPEADTAADSATDEPQQQSAAEPESQAGEAETEAPAAKADTPAEEKEEKKAEPQAAESRPQRARADESGDEDAPGVEPAEISTLLEQIFHDMEFECTVEVATEDEGFLATIGGADKEELLEGNGRCLSALELIVNNAFRNKLPRSSKIRVDAGDFRSRRDQELADVAYQVAHSAKQTGRTQETQPLNPYERRLVHLALAEDPTVTTRSRGSGFLKNVQVIPQKSSGRRGGQGRRR